MTAKLDNRRVAVAARVARFAAVMDWGTDCPYVGDDEISAVLRRVWLSTYLRLRPPALDQPVAASVAVGHASSCDHATLGSVCHCQCGGVRHSVSHTGGVAAPNTPTTSADNTSPAAVPTAPTTGRNTPATDNPDPTPTAGDPTDPAEFDRRTGGALTEEAALDATPHSVTPRGIDRLTDAQRSGLLTYRGAYYEEINHILRNGEDDNYRSFYTMPVDDVRAHVAGIDSAMNESALPEDIITLRGIRAGSRIFGDRMGGDLTGAQWREDAYVSTTTSPAIAGRFAGANFAQDEPGAVLMRMLTPAGVGATQLSGPEYEYEVLLQRGLSMRVVRDRGLDSRGVRMLDVEVLPAG